MTLPALIIGWIITYRYLIILPLVVVEGPIVMLVCGFIMRLGAFDLVPLYLALVAGDFIGDIIWYYIGKHGARRFIERFGRFFSVTMADVERFEGFFKQHQTAILFVSKITLGFGFAGAVLLAAGIVRVPLRKYLLLNLLGGFVWTAILLTIGYVFGNFFLTLNAGFRIASLLAAAALIVLALYGFARFMRRRFLQNQGSTLGQDS